MLLLFVDLFLFCYERDFMKFFSRENQADIIEAFNSTSRYLDVLLNIDNIYFEFIVDRIYRAEFQLNKANSSDTEAPVLDLNLSISNGTVSTKIYDKRDDFDFLIVNFPFLDSEVPLFTSYGVYLSQLIRFAGASSNVNDFNCRNKALTAKLLRQGYHYHKLRITKIFSKFYPRHIGLVEKYNVSLRKLLQLGISEPEYYGDLVYVIQNQNPAKMYLFIHLFIYYSFIYLFLSQFVQTFRFVFTTATTTTTTTTTTTITTTNSTTKVNVTFPLVARHGIAK